jgi:hypothetical protein
MIWNIKLSQQTTDTKWWQHFTLPLGWQHFTLPLGWQHFTLPLGWCANIWSRQTHWDNNAKHCPAELLDDDRDAVDEARYKLITIVCKKKRRKKNNTLPFQSVKIYLHSDISADYLCVYLSIFVVQWSAAAVRHFAGKKKEINYLWKKKKEISQIYQICMHPNVQLAWNKTKSQISTDYL